MKAKKVTENGKIFYIKVKFEGIWGRKSNTKWGGEESKAIEQYTPLPGMTSPTCLARHPGGTCRRQTGCRPRPGAQSIPGLSCGPGPWRSRPAELEALGTSRCSCTGLTPSSTGWPSTIETPVVAGSRASRARQLTL